MRGWYKRKYPRERHDPAAGAGTGLSPGVEEPDTPVPGFTDQDVDGSIKDAGCSMYDPEKVYLGVRVKMPVKDLLRNIRTAQGQEAGSFQKIYDKAVKGEKKRVKTRKVRQTNKRSCSGYQRKWPTKSLEELEFIVEVLEEDLRTSSSYRSPPQSLSCSYPPGSPGWSPTGGGYNSDESDEMIPSPQFFRSLSPGTAESHKCHDWKLNTSAFFWTQLQREESQLRGISDAVLLSADQHGRTALHKVACVGKRALGYCMAKRMAALNCLDLKDSDGMSPLLLAAKHNQYLMVADLIRWGADVNVTNSTGKSCLHLSAERGYVRVLEVLKRTMMDGVFVDVEATDNSGMSVLQCASLALKATVRELESSKSPTLHTLHQEQMMETLEYLLQMGSYLHAMVGRSVQPLMG